MTIVEASRLKLKQLEESKDFEELYRFAMCLTKYLANRQAGGGYVVLDALDPGKQILFSGDRDACEAFREGMLRGLLLPTLYDIVVCVSEGYMIVIPEERFGESV